MKALEMRWQIRTTCPSEMRRADEIVPAFSEINCLCNSNEVRWPLPVFEGDIATDC